MRGSYRLTPEELKSIAATSARQLSALLTWGLAPCGFLAIGQAPALYNDSGSYTKFKQLVKRNGGSPSDRAGALYWPKVNQDEAKQIAMVACDLKLRWFEEGPEQTYLGFPNA